MDLGIYLMKYNLCKTFPTCVELNSSSNEKTTSKKMSSSNELPFMYFKICRT